jgi:hypothetical protein
MQIIPYLRKHGTDPVTGKKMSSGDLIPLKFAKNADGLSAVLTRDPFVSDNLPKHQVTITILSPSDPLRHIRREFDRQTTRSGLADLTLSYWLASWLLRQQEMSIRASRWNS